MVTGELIDIERITISSERGRWKSTRKGNSLASYSTSRSVLRGLGGRNLARLPGATELWNYPRINVHDLQKLTFATPKPCS